MKIFLLSLLTVLSIRTMPINCAVPVSVSDEKAVSICSDINQLEIENNSNNEKVTP